MEEALAAYLLAFAGLTGLVSNRVQWVRRPQGAALPAVVLHRIGGTPSYTMEDRASLVSSRVQVDCWGSSYASVKAVARQVDERLSGVRFSQGGVTFQGSFKDGEQDSYEQDEGGGHLYRVSMDYILWHSS